MFPGHKQDIKLKIRTWEDIHDWIISHAGELDYLEQYEGLDNFIGSGAYGKVWKIKNKELTIKVTTEESEIAISNVLEGKNTRAFLKIYKTINIDSNPPVQFKIQEMCYDTEFYRDSRFIDYCMIFIDKVKHNPYTIEEFFEFVREYNPERAELIKDINVKNIEKLLSFIKNVYLDTEELGMEEEFPYLDIHKNNIMVDKNGNYKLVDF